MLTFLVKKHMGFPYIAMTVQSPYRFVFATPLALQQQCWRFTVCWPFKGLVDVSVMLPISQQILLVFANPVLVF